MDMNDSGLNLLTGLVIGLFLGVGIAYLVLWSVRRQAGFVQQHINKYNLELDDDASAYLISNKLTIILDQSQVVISDIRQDSPERIDYSNLESVRTEWQKMSEMHRLTIKLRSGEVHSHRIMQVYHNNFKGQPSKSKKQAVIITDVVRSHLESAGVKVETIR